MGEGRRRRAGRLDRRCAPEMLPCVAPNAIGRPISTGMSAGTTVVASDLCRKSAVRALVPFGRTELGLAPSDSTSHGLNARVAPPPPAPLRMAVSQGGALGPLLHPHQLFVAVTVPGPPLSTRRPTRRRPLQHCPRSGRSSPSGCHRRGLHRRCPGRRIGGHAVADDGDLLVRGRRARAAAALNACPSPSRGAVPRRCSDDALGRYHGLGADAVGADAAALPPGRVAAVRAARARQLVAPIVESWMATVP